jgi:hypothetical protein
MATIDLTEFAGVVTAPGLLARNPASCVDAINWEFPAPGLIRKRRGFSRLNANAGGPVWKLFTSRLLGDNLLAHTGTATAGNTLRYGDGAGVGLTGLNQIDGQPLTRTVDLNNIGNRMQVAVCQRNQYCTADEGVARLESNLGLVRYAGMPRGRVPGMFNAFASPANFILNPTGTFLPQDYARAYRVTWHRKDADGVELGGAPTARFVAANRNGYPFWVAVANCGVVIDIPIPIEFGTSNTAIAPDTYYFRLWGTRTYNETTELGNDEMSLITERYVSAAEIALGKATVIDDTPDSFLGSAPTLHTNLYNFPSPDEAGILQGVANEDAPPPQANDVAYWKDCMWYADYTYRPSLTLALISNFADGDLVVVFIGATSMTLTARLAPGSATDFALINTFTDSAVNIRLTVANMCAAISAQARILGMGVDAFPTGTSSTTPGLFMVEASRPSVVGVSELQFETSADFRFQTTFGYKFGGFPVVPNSATNGLAYSKRFRADAVPPVNLLAAGPTDATILRAVPFRDRLLLFTDYGIHQVTGNTWADFVVSPFDLGFRLMARECVVMCDQRLYAWCIEGIVEIDDGGVTVISQAIEPTIESAIVNASGIGTPSGAQALSLGRKVFAVYAFATAFASQHQVRFHYPQANDPANLRGCAYWLAFDTRTRTWTRGVFALALFGGYLDSRSCAVARISDDSLFCANWSTGADTYLFQERRKYDANDYRETARDGSTSAVYSQLTFQYQLPVVDGAVHWQQTLLNWDVGFVAGTAIPTSISLSYESGEGTSSSLTVATTVSATRVEPDASVRRSQRLAITLIHNTAEYAGIVGVSQTYRQGSRFARRVTP